MAQKIVTHLWYTEKAEDAARFYVSVFPNSQINAVTVMPGESPSGPEGSVVWVEFTLDGQEFQAITAGPLDPFNHAISLIVQCDSQTEIDRYWHELGAGGSYEQCGWLKDKYGVSWQITPRILGEMMKDKDRTKARRVTEAMLKMVKLDVAALEKAYNG